MSRLQDLRRDHAAAMNRFEDATELFAANRAWDEVSRLNVAIVRAEHDWRAGMVLVASIPAAVVAVLLIGAVFGA